MTTNITFGTNCWERDWKYVLDESRLKLLSERTHFPIAERVLMINNVKSKTKVRKQAERALSWGAFSKYVFVEDHAEKALDFFDLSRADLGAGYWYSIAELVLIFLCETEFLLYFKGDCIPLDASDWITPSIQLMNKDQRIKVCNAAWDEKHNEAKAESTEENELFYIGHGFSDQCFLVRTVDFYGHIYGEDHPDSERFPLYAGNSFERRVNSWMQNKGFLRATYKHTSYLHCNWPLTTAERLKNISHRVYRRVLRGVALPTKPA